MKEASLKSNLNDGAQKSKNRSIVGSLLGNNSGNLVGRGFEDFHISNINGILHFSSQKAVSLFFDEVDSLETEYDYSNSTDWDDTEQEIYHLGDAMLNEFDSVLSFKSLRANYERLEYNDENFQEKIKNFIDDPYLPIILNENLEVVVGNKYYNFSVAGITIESSDISLDVINQIRVNGIRYINDAVTLYDIDGNVISRPNDDRSIRVMDFFFRKEYTNQALNVEINVFVGSNYIEDYTGLNAYLYQCRQWEYTINWGDGTSTVTSSDDYMQNFAHSYNKDVIPQGECSSYNITVTVKKITADCYTIFPDIFILNSTVLVGNTLSIPVCNINCFFGKRRTTRNYEFEYEGTRYRIRGEVQQNSSPFFAWTQPKIWGRITFYKKRGGRFKKSKPPVSLTATILGTVYDIDCTNATKFEESRTNGHRREFKVKYKPHFPLTTYQYDFYPVFGNFKAVMGYSGSQEISQTLENVKLWD